MNKRLSEDELEQALQIANRIIEEHKPKPRRITITKDDKEAFFMLWDMFHDADCASDGNWMSSEDRAKINRLYKKIMR